MTTAMIQVEIVFAMEKQRWHKTMTLSSGSTIEQALQQSQLYSQHPEAKHLKVGIFGEICPLDMLLEQGDRIEVYRPLVFDPMESRRRRAAHRAAKQNVNQRSRPKPSAAASMIVNQS